MVSPLRRAFPVAGGELQMAEQTGLTQIQLFAGGLPHLEAGVVAALGVVPGERIGDVVGEATRVMTVAPGRWLVVAPLATAALDRLEAAGARVVDLSASRVVVRLSGAGTVSLLQKGCGLDLAPAAFPPGSCASTLVSHYQCLLHRLPDGATFDIYVARSLARSAWEWLCETAATDSAAHLRTDHRHG